MTFICRSGRKSAVVSYRRLRREKAGRRARCHAHEEIFAPAEASPAFSGGTGNGAVRTPSRSMAGRFAGGRSPRGWFLCGRVLCGWVRPGFRSGVARFGVAGSAALLRAALAGRFPSKSALHPAGWVVTSSFCWSRCSDSVSPSRNATSRCARCCAPRGGPGPHPPGSPGGPGRSARTRRAKTAAPSPRIPQRWSPRPWPSQCGRPRRPRAFDSGHARSCDASGCGFVARVSGASTSGRGSGSGVAVHDLVAGASAPLVGWSAGPAGRWSAGWQFGERAGAAGRLAGHGPAGDGPAGDEQLARDRLATGRTGRPQAARPGIDHEFMPGKLALLSPVNAWYSLLSTSPVCIDNND